MFGLGNSISVYLMPGYTDMRKGVFTLASLSEEITKKNFLEGSLFVFMGKRRDKVKIVYWDKNGFCLWQKVLDKEKFWWPKNSQEVKQMTVRELEWLLEGLNLSNVSGHKKLDCKMI